MNDREKVICPSAKFATKVFIPKRTKMSENDSEAKTGSGTAFREAAKTRQSRNGEFVYDYMRITISNRVTLNNEQYSLYSAFILILMKSHTKKRN